MLVLKRSPGESVVVSDTATGAELGRVTVDRVYGRQALLLRFQGWQGFRGPCRSHHLRAGYQLSIMRGADEFGVVKVVTVRDGTLRLGLDFPQSVSVDRAELREAVHG